MKLSKHKAVPFFLIALLISSACAEGLWAGTVVCTSTGSVTIEPGFNGVCASDLAAKKKTIRLDETSSRPCPVSCQDMSLSLEQDNWIADSKNNYVPSEIPIWPNHRMDDVKALCNYLTFVLESKNITIQNTTCLNTIRLII
jgi:hypothetical protein